MPIGTALANNLKVNNMIGAPPNQTITAPETTGGHHHREMSLDDERGNRRQNINTAGMSNGGGNNKADIIASRIVNQSKSPDRYIIGNNLVVNLNGGTPGVSDMNQTQYNLNPSINMSNASSQGGKPVSTKAHGGGSIFPSTTTATTANSMNEAQQQHHKRLSGLEPLGHPPQTMHQRFRSLNYP